MNDKQMFKVLSPVTRKDGSTYWMRVGSGFPNRDASINLYLDALPINQRLQLRQVTEDDERRDAARATSAREPVKADAMPF